MPTYLVSGANRGLGYEMVKQLSALPRTYILAEIGRRIKVVPLEVTDPESVKNVVDEVEKWEHTKGGLDVLLNNAGVFAGGWATALEATPADIQSNLNINLYGTISLTLALLPSLLRPSAATPAEDDGGSPVKQIYTYSSGMGSITSTQNNALAGARRIPKDGKDVVVKALHPGWATTGMTGAGEGYVSPEDSVKGMIEVILSAKRGDPTVLVSYKNEVLPW
ncbi:hypothetical protein EHS25_002754 [Saitozyma podzolica]|uniref:NAD(P)-binding protein n=1 Tax=Saitozyma podzolica TaxID=1890683 RepID=A0A427YDB8_9TREE|nr:hypothetical protein EHS25_002754 [Saitozyma podzolica]